MKKENLLLIFWMIFGFTIIQSIDCILIFIINLFYLLELKLNIDSNTITIITPIFVVFIYLTTTFLILKKIKTNSNSDGIHLTDFPNMRIFFLALIPIFFNPFSSTVFNYYRIAMEIEHDRIHEELLISYSSMMNSILITRWLILIGLVTIFTITLKKIKEKTKHNNL